MRAKRIVCCLFFVILIVTGCGSKVDSDGNFTLDSNWKLVEYSFNGNTTNVKDDPTAQLAADKAPDFKCSDGKNITFSLNGKDHSGKATREGDGYRITFDDTYKPLIATINGNKLSMKTENNKVEFVFEAE